MKSAAKAAAGWIRHGQSKHLSLAWALDKASANHCHRKQTYPKFDRWRSRSESKLVRQIQTRWLACRISPSLAFRPPHWGGLDNYGLGGCANAGFHNFDGCDGCGRRGGGNAGAIYHPGTRGGGNVGAIYYPGTRGGGNAGAIYHPGTRGGGNAGAIYHPGTRGGGNAGAIYHPGTSGGGNVGGIRGHGNITIINNYNGGKLSRPVTRINPPCDEDEDEEEEDEEEEEEEEDESDDDENNNEDDGRRSAIERFRSLERVCMQLHAARLRQTWN
ncbi:keratin, type I cytoskeletal 10 [Phoenix dactylifera]|uniref:Keratin, type I cytoskeletal 10 n=1 Tax=Phoenix dactylifera TaxID=42345 RepID=A0A8B9B269_PHODC|nr:keratin, type I cytoskeletal 10 [Phoenix dactylifera]